MRNFMTNKTLSWQEWDTLDATAMAGLVAKGDVTAQELAVQAAAAVGRVNPKINAVLEVFDDVVADPTADRVTRIATAQRIIPIAAFDRVAACIPINDVVPTHAVDEIVAGLSVELVVAFTTDK